MGEYGVGMLQGQTLGIDGQSVKAWGKYRNRKCGFLHSIKSI